MTESSQPLGYWIALVHTSLDGRFADALEEHGVTRGQWHLLSILRRTGMTPAADITGAAASESASPDDLSELVESGWVASGDLYSLTERGSLATDRLADVVDSIASLADRVLDDAERAGMEASLRRVAEVLGWSDSSAVP